VLTKFLLIRKLNKIAFQSNADHTQMYLVTLMQLFCSRGLDIDLLMTLIYELDLHVLKLYLHTKNGASNNNNNNNNI